MYLARLLQINMATLAALGALLLGMGQRTEGPPLLVALAAAVSVWLTDITGWFRLDRRVANLLMLVGGALCARDLYPPGNEVQALQLVWFLIYLQIILLFQKKDERIYWSLILLSLLQVVVATLFSQGVWFGVLLTTYMLLGFSGMTLLLMHRQWERQRPKALPPTVTPSTNVRTSRWPLIDATSDFVCSPGGSGHAGLCSDLFGRLARMGLHTLTLTLVLFFAVPRFDAMTWKGPAVANPQSLVGFSDSVELGQLGEAIEDPSKVMQVNFSDKTGRPLLVHGEIYLQGAILMNYAEGRWQTGMPSWNARAELLEDVPDPPETGLVRQEIQIEALRHNDLFFVAPFIPLKPTFEMSFDHGRQRLVRADQICSSQFRYKLGTTAIVGGMQKPLVPRERREATRERALAMPEDAGAPALPNLKKLATQWIQESGLPESDRVGRARYLERKLAFSDQFKYSLVGQPRDPELDPIEDFLTKNPQGHCEYFATALTLMLRSQGIPARMVIGYKCDEWNAMGGFYQVRQLHAHSWVQAFLRYPEIPQQLLHGQDYWPWERNGGWLILDPTPGGASAARQTDWFTPVTGAMDWLDTAWSKYFVELNSQRQRDAIYQPIASALKETWHNLTDAQQWQARFDALLAAIHMDQLSGLAAWLAMITAGILALAILAAVGWLLWRMMRRIRGRWRGNHAGRNHDQRSNIKFYRHFETILARRGIFRAAGQTQREFAEDAGMRLALAAGRPELATVPYAVADAFYRVRFGGQPLDNVQAQAVEHAMKQLSETNT